MTDYLLFWGRIKIRLPIFFHFAVFVLHSFIFLLFDKKEKHNFQILMIKNINYTLMGMGSWLCKILNYIFAPSCAPTSEAIELYIYIYFHLYKTEMRSFSIKRALCIYDYFHLMSYALQSMISLLFSFFFFPIEIDNWDTPEWKSNKKISHIGKVLYMDITEWTNQWSLISVHMIYIYNAWFIFFVTFISFDKKKMERKRISDSLWLISLRHPF